jgi:hypothetical protein
LATFARKSSEPANPREVFRISPSHAGGYTLLPLGSVNNDEFHLVVAQPGKAADPSGLPATQRVVQDSQIVTWMA